MTTALLFDRNQVDEVDDWTQQVDHLGRRSILWIDLDRDDRRQLEEAVESLELRCWRRTSESSRRSSLRSRSSTGA